MKPSFLQTPIEYLKGVGPLRADALKKEIGIFTYEDLLFYYPFRYADRTKFTRISELHEESGLVQIKGVIERCEIIGQKKGKRLSAWLRDETGAIELVWFKAHQWMLSRLHIGKEYVVYGKAALFGSRFNIAHPDLDEATPEFFARQSAYQSVYSSTEKLKLKGLDSEGIRKLQRALSEQVNDEHVEDVLSDEIKLDHSLLGKAEALRKIHFPNSEQELKKARMRLKFEELFYVQLRLLRLHSFREKNVKGFVISKIGNFFNDYYNHHLPYALTGAQKRVIKEIRADLGSGRQMNRLVQGDVGSGKTLVALMSMLLVIDNSHENISFQACLMAPTEILAKQHYQTFTEMLGNLQIRCELLTGSSTAKLRKQIHSGLESGEVNILIGTHALIEEKVKFKNLGIAVIDEQHRFGVEQRSKLGKKNIHPPHILLMTATPIPRTLAMTLYGDLDVSVIDEMPPGRKPIKTVHYNESQRLRVFGFMREQIKLGRQVYVVFPLIQESEKIDLQNLQQGYENIIHEFPLPEFKVSIVHGKLSNEQKEFEMNRFVKKETQIMVATTVIEVGVNVPNASVMVIESAERFGLSQLHQLRGRVGRGADQSYCILMTGNKLGPDSKLRMETMERTNDGFEISEVDLKLRGPGDIEGTMQSGNMNLKLADLARDGQLLQMARQTAQMIIEEDPELELKKNELYKNQMTRIYANKKDWSKIG